MDQEGGGMWITAVCSLRRMNEYIEGDGIPGDLQGNETLLISKEKTHS